MEPGGAEPPSKVFTFKDDQRSPPVCLSVSIPEVLDPHYGMYVWPCAVVLAQYLWTRRETLRGKKVLELGAGVSLPGVVAARCGAQVTLSDGAKTPLCLDNCRRSCEANGLLDVGVLSLTWGEVSPELLLLPELDIILGSDVFYEPQVEGDACSDDGETSQDGDDGQNHGVAAQTASAIHVALLQTVSGLNGKNSEEEVFGYFLSGGAKIETSNSQLA
uniref:Methyltransferase 23, arginine n=1 Tax=Cyclopterus lumpus TaxID=8103 RepID=A0A8C2WJ36_CYCLU